MSASLPDVVVYCDDGHDEVVVQRFRWLTEQDIWIPTRRAAPEIPIYPVDSPVFPGFDGPVADRSRWQLRCPKCGRNSPARGRRGGRGGRLNNALLWLVAEKQNRISLKLWPELLKKWPTDIRSTGQYPN
ncbi:MAG: hypothetical protein ACR2JU_04050 [Nocardioidaceae bacterium]